MPPKFMPNIQWTLLKKKSPNLLILHLRGYNPLRQITFQLLFNLKKQAHKLNLITPHLPPVTQRYSVYLTTVFARRY